MLKILPLILLFGQALASTTPESNNDTKPSPFVPGSDEPSDPATTGYFMNKVGISVSNLTRSMDFYTQVFGFRHMFTFHATPDLSITYLGHSSGGRNGTGYQSAEEMTRDKNNAAGHLELIHLSATDNAQLQSIPTFRHIMGIIVPNSTETQARLDKYGAKIYKRIEEPMPTTGPLGDPFAFGDATDLSAKGWAAIREAMTELNLQGVFASDPDGNLLEVLPEEETQLVGG
ncbi:hypothetical protein F66182_930 [Fusarium sp. NRRL 66182]|nr:hypothetical protein F66182_930 [Fusarium sp. NRRL 66182]